MEKSALITSFELLLNQALSADNNAKKNFLALYPKTIGLTISQKALHLVIHKNHLALNEEPFNKTPDVCLNTTLEKLMVLSLSHPSKRKTIMKTTFTIEGDILLAEQVEKIFMNIKPDWIGLLSQVFDDNIATHLLVGLNGLKNKTTHHLKSVKENICEYLQEEEKISPTQIEARLFLDEIDELVLQYDRVQAKFNQLLTNKS